eukprot:883943-Prymnesium_polylepis.2
MQLDFATRRASLSRRAPRRAPLAASPRPSPQRVARANSPRPSPHAERRAAFACVSVPAQLRRPLLGRDLYVSAAGGGAGRARRPRRDV